jgi:hypothetical protein
MEVVREHDMVQFWKVYVRGRVSEMVTEVDNKMNSGKVTSEPFKKLWQQW